MIFCQDADIIRRKTNTQKGIQEMGYNKTSNESSSKSDSFIYDNNAFVHVLIQMIGTQKKADFAAAAGISAAHVSRVLQGHLTGRPTRHTVDKLARTTSDPVLLEELYRVTGYTYTPETTLGTSLSRAESIPFTPDAAVCERFFYIMMDYLTSLRNDKGIRWILDKGSKDSGFLSVSLPDGPVDTMDLILINDRDDITSEIQKKMIYLLYGQLAARRHQTKVKTSYVTTLSENFDAFINMPPFSLNALVSVILIDTNTHSIVKEEFLPSACSMFDEVDERQLLFR